MYTNAASDVNDVIAQKNQYPFLNVDPFPFTNANLTDSLNMPTLDDDEVYDTSVYSSKRVLSKDEKRAEHNAIERARRESLNSKFQQLAQVLPNLMNYRRPSKSQIVEKALDWVKKSISREERYRYQVIQLQKENKQLLAQLMVNHSSLSSSSSSSSPPPVTPSASLSTPVTTNHQQQQKPTGSASKTFASHPFTIPSANTTTGTDIPTLHQQFIYDIPPESPWLSAQRQSQPSSSLLPSSLTSPLIYGSMDDLHSAYDKKNLDLDLFQSQSTDLYLDTKLSPSPEFIQPVASRSTPAFSSVYHR